MKNKLKIMLVLLGCAGVANAAYVTIGGAGNSNDTSYGGVSYEYKISDHEVTIAEFNASGAGSGNEGYWNEGTRTVGTAAPASNVSLYEAMKYCNYLTTGNINSGYYSDAGGGVWQANALAHDAYAAANGITYFVPTDDEWYKAAYYSVSGDSYSLYADGSGTVPTEGGGATGWNYNYVTSLPNRARDTALGTNEQNGTVNMMGNVWEWMEDSGGAVRGGSFYSGERYLSSVSRTTSYLPSDEYSNVGFRPVEVVPEPATMGLLGVGALITLLVRLKQRL